MAGTWGLMLLLRNDTFPQPAGPRDVSAVSPGPWDHSDHHRLDTSCLPLSVSLSPAGSFLQLLQEPLTSSGSLCPGGRSRERVAIIRGDCWEAGCHGRRGRGCTPKLSQGSRLCDSRCGDRHTHGKGEGSSSLRTGTLQSKGRVHLDMGRARLAEGPRPGLATACCLLLAPLLCLCSQRWLLTR